MTKTDLNIGLIDRRGPEGNIFFIMAAAIKIMNAYGFNKLADEMKVRVMDCQSYEEACKVIAEYVEVEYVN